MLTRCGARSRAVYLSTALLERRMLNGPGPSSLSFNNSPIKAANGTAICIRHLWGTTFSSEYTTTQESEVAGQPWSDVSEALSRRPLQAGLIAAQESKLQAIKSYPLDADIDTQILFPPLTTMQHVAKSRADVVDKWTERYIRTPELAEKTRPPRSPAKSPEALPELGETTDLLLNPHGKKKEAQSLDRSILSKIQLLSNKYYGRKLQTDYQTDLPGFSYLRQRLIKVIEKRHQRHVDLIIGEVEGKESLVRELKGAKRISEREYQVQLTDLLQAIQIMRRHEITYLKQFAQADRSIMRAGEKLAASKEAARKDSAKEAAAKDGFLTTLWRAVVPAEEAKVPSDSQAFGKRDIGVEKKLFRKPKTDVPWVVRKGLKKNLEGTQRADADFSVRSPNENLTSTKHVTETVEWSSLSRGSPGRIGNATDKVIDESLHHQDLAVASPVQTLTSGNTRDKDEYDIQKSIQARLKEYRLRNRMREPTTDTWSDIPESARPKDWRENQASLGRLSSNPKNRVSREGNYARSSQSRRMSTRAGPTREWTHIERTEKEWRDTSLHYVRVVDVQDATPNVRLIKLEEKNDEAVDFRPGQWLDVIIPSISKPGGFTLTSAPPVLELAIQKAPQNPASLWFWRDKEDVRDGEISVRVGGSFILPQNIDYNRIVFVAGGVGINPFMSMIQHLYNSSRLDAIHIDLLYSSKDSPPQFYDRLVDIFISSPSSTLQIFQTSASSIADEESLPGNITITERRLTEKDVMRAVGGGHDTLVYICGPKNMTDQYFELVQAQTEVPEERVFVEKWW